MLCIKDLKKSFSQPGGGRLPVLDIASLGVEEGEQVALVGRSGRGKTTLLHLIAGLTTADSGSITINGTEMTQLSESGRDRFRAAMIGYVFQTFNLLPGFSALENVRLGMSFARGKPNSSQARELLDRVGLADRVHYRPSQLSVGQQQRVAIARALAGSPKVLLADEPTANVDPANQQNIIELITQTCRDQRISLLLVTHSSQVSDHLQRVVELEQINTVGASKIQSPGERANA